ncbi:putative bifunctional diguanylate cyclase/phosphodiesterase [Marinobacter fonticola]|uniref:putative bifunctional diguanylate cyclase/phosphodiesterase n=1 Tax=Marinobacter fonticola TaxID=2603215 RepID=UPI0011E61FBD|nr:bifunctional diguanylate cyclase/phosphodiesterase [Marinobacter fonticola]
MRLTDFIRSSLEEILQAWEKNAAAILPDRNYTRDELRDHVRHMLMGITADMERPLTELEQNERSQGFGPRPESETSAQIHGAERQDLGADIVQVATEFRALRTTIIQLWQKGGRTELETADVDDIVRFYEAIDQALVESVDRYAHEKEKQGRLFETMLASLPDPCCVLGLDGRFLYANRTMADLCGLTRTELVGRKFEEFKLHTSYNGLDPLQQVISSKKEVRGDIEIGAHAERARHFEYVYSPVLDAHDNVEAVSGIAHDVTERKQSEATIWHHANYDHLTDVPNRRLFIDRLNQHASHSVRTGEPFAVLFIDLDRFKEVNDQLGHDAGDRLLQIVARRIESHIRQSDTVARLGGDEFTVLLLNAGSREDVEQIASSILRDLAKPFYLNNDGVTISGSIGITLLPNDAQTVKQLMNNADQAMYLAKSAGRNQLCFFEDVMAHAVTARQELVGYLRAAPEKGELCLHYQPIVDLKTGRIAKAEALLRWHHPVRGLLAPGEFLELAEEAGLMETLENWVFSEVAADVQHWGMLSQEPFQVTINTSPLQFMHNDHIKPWEPHLGAFAESSTSIAVELSESVFLQDSAHLDERFSTLHKAGIQLALDDFGTGYSSLAYLKRFDINYLKIDPSFVRDDGTNPSNKAIAETIVVMAHKLGLQVVAEGVETEAQRDWLKEAGCDYAQGFLFSHPMPAVSMELLLKSGRAFH